MVEVDQLLSVAVPYILGAIRSYRIRVLDDIAEGVPGAAADATVRMGKRLLRSLLSREDRRPMIETAVRDFVDDPEDKDFEAAIRAQIKAAIRNDRQLAAEWEALIRAAPQVGNNKALNAQSVQGAQVGDFNQQTNYFG